MSSVNGANEADAAEQPQPTKRQIARWQQYLANERAEGDRKSVV